MAAVTARASLTLRAPLTPLTLRALARGALEEAGARGFVRFAPAGDEALLLTDAAARLSSAPFSVFSLLWNTPATIRPVR